MITIIISLLAALHRRIWGGWFSPNHFLKIGVGYVLAFVACWLSSGNTYAALAIALVVGSSYWYDIPGIAWLHHAYGQRMGRGDPTDSPSLYKCILAMGARYGIPTTLAAIVWFSITADPLTLLYAIAGFLVPFGYLLSRVVSEKINIPNFGRIGTSPDGTPNYFYNGPTCFGELLLGAIMIGTLLLV